MLASGLHKADILPSFSVDDETSQLLADGLGADELDTLRRVTIRPPNFKTAKPYYVTLTLAQMKDG